MVLRLTPARVLEIPLAHDVLAIEDAPRLVAGLLHRDRSVTRDRVRFRTAVLRKSWRSLWTVILFVVGS